MMGTSEEVQVHIKEESQESNSSSTATLCPEDANLMKQPSLPRRINYRWWLVVSLYTLCLIISQAGATLLGKFYFRNGGNSKWLATIVQSAGFPLVIPILVFYSPSSATSDPSNNIKTTSLSVPKFALLYLFFGLLVSADNLMYSYGQLYLPVSTYSLLCATQLAFNVLFSYFLNSLKFTAFILNSIVLLTISASILAFHVESSGPSTVSTTNYIVGIICTIGASALYSLVLSLIQVCFEKFLKMDSIRVILEMQIYPALLATCICVVGLFVSGEWSGLKGEMQEFKTGKVSYLMTLVWNTVLWQVFSVCCLGLIYEASSLLSNVVSSAGLAVIPLLGIALFHDKMDGMKVVAMLLAAGGFISYFYQHYLDESTSNSSTGTKANTSALR